MQYLPRYPKAPDKKARNKDIARFVQTPNDIKPITDENRGSEISFIFIFLI